MSHFLSLIILLLALVGILVGLINALRKYKNHFVKLRWVLIPLAFSLTILILDIYVGNLDWKIINMFNELNPQRQDSLKIENNKAKKNLGQRDNSRKIRSKSIKKKESQNSKENLITNKKEPEEVNQKLYSRILTSEQRNKFINFLKDKPKGDFRIEYIDGDVEAFEYSKNIANMLKDAGYNLSGIRNFVGNDAVKGISIVVNSDETRPLYAQSIFSAFRSIGINIKAELNRKSVKPLEVLISIGHKNKY